MWLVPTGYCYLLQVGSIGNDLFSAVLALAAVDLWAAGAGVAEGRRGVAVNSGGGGDDGEQGDDSGSAVAVAGGTGALP